MEEHRPRLGRGLAALLATPDQVTSPAPAHRQRRVPLEHLRPNPRNPRKAFAEAELVELGNSIKARGVLQPIVVRPAGGEDDRYEIVAGERRWRAAQRAGVHDVPVVIVEADDKLALELAIVENVQRADLNPAEEARGYRSLIAEYGYGQADLGEAIGKSRSHVANTLRLLKLPADVLDLLESGAISAGHARALLAVPNPAKTAADIVRKGLSVREVERLAAEQPAKAPRRNASPADPDTRALSEALTQQTGLKIAIERRGERGRIVIEYNSTEQFDYINRKLSEI
ncbi:MAG TPA: ParB/RepB/Spo0J family partition protein [Chthoniobacterales bacterium]